VLNLLLFLLFRDVRVNARFGGGKEAPYPVPNCPGAENVEVVAAKGSGASSDASKKDSGGAQAEGT
jgi:hypothetical protein